MHTLNTRITSRRTRTVALVAAGLLSLASSVQAEPLLAVTTGNVLLRIDSLTPGSTLSVPVSGTGGEQILGIDFRPATGQLYGVGSASNLYIIDPLTGVATVTAPISSPLTGTSFGTDFNPTVDRLRVTSDDEQNLRINPAGGVAIVDTALAFGMLDMNFSANPNVVGAAYTNNFFGATSTMLFGIDSTLDLLVLQNPANAGILQTVGSLGVNAPSLLGFDISGRTGIAYAAWASSLYTINLANGSASLVGLVNTPDGQQIRGLAAPVPEPSLMALLGLGVLTAFRRRAIRR